MVNHSEGISRFQPIPPPPPERKKGTLRERTVTQRTPSKKDIALSSKVEGLAGLLRSEVKSLAERSVSKGPPE